MNRVLSTSLYLAPKESSKIVEWIIERMHGQNQALEMRLMIGGFHDYIQWKTGQSHTGWEDLLETRIRRQTTFYKSRSERMADEKIIAQEIMAMNVSTKEKERIFKEKTGKSLRALYRRVAHK